MKTIGLLFVIILVCAGIIFSVVAIERNNKAAALHYDFYECFRVEVPTGSDRPYVRGVVIDRLFEMAINLNTRRDQIDCQQNLYRSMSPPDSAQLVKSYADFKQKLNRMHTDYLRCRVNFKKALKLARDAGFGDEADICKMVSTSSNTTQFVAGP